ncbi:MAG: hypothetical protein Q8N03_01755 [Ignavibacteria bacterium]|nr:hypothetical protein [Ignavibacteria bacterium]
MLNQLRLTNKLLIILSVMTITLSSGCSDKKTIYELSSYQNYFDSLKIDLVHSIPSAANYYLKNIKSLSVEKRDSAFFIFTHYYYKVKFKLNDSLMYDLDLLNKLENKAFNKDSVVTGFKKIVSESGFKLNQSEGYYYVEESPNYLYSKFGKYVSPAISEYLSIRKKELNEGFAQDAALMISFKSITQRILTWQDYLIKFPDSYYSSQVNSYTNMYINALLGGLDNSPIFDENRLLLPEVKKAYDYFIQKSDSTENFLLINDLYKKLEKNSFKVNDEILDLINSRHESNE